MMRAPAFWWQPRRAGRSGRGLLLAPVGAIYGAVAARNMARRGRTAGVPVICIGNLTVGGAGKTPAALAVVRLLLAAHERPFFLSRGYGGSLAGPLLVKPNAHKAAEVGDEPLLLAGLASTIVARDRIAGARAARRRGAGIIVMDDGFQNPSLRKNLAVIMVDGRRGIGNGRVLPAGPLRAPLEFQLARADAVVIVGSQDGASGADSVAERALRRGIAVFHGRIEPDPHGLAALHGRKALAFAGIADPEKFFATLAEAGIEIAERESFADHHRYTAKDAAALLARADAHDLMLLTTEKDRVRLAGEPQLAALAARTAALPVRLVIDEQEAFRAMVLKAVKHG